MPEKLPIPEAGHPVASQKNQLSTDVEIKGNIKFSGELSFDGRLEGDVITEGVLHLGDNATVTGNISAQTVYARGKINGTSPPKIRSR